MAPHDEHAPFVTDRGAAAPATSSELDTAMMSAHRKNIARYRGLLGGALSADERRYVERRIAEAQAALRRICRDAPPFSIAARP